jgi:hypothetical protein
MATQSKPPEWLDPSDGPKEPGYDAWKRAKIERALASSKDRRNLIPAEQVWRELGLED